MKSLIVFIMALTLLGCGRVDQKIRRKSSSHGTITKPDLRGFQTFVTMDETPLAEIRCNYVGKKPEEPIDIRIERDWASADTDFYHYTISNVSDQTIELRRIDHSVTEVDDGAVFKTDDREAIQQELGTTKILPGESVTRRNSWVGGENGKSRTLKKTYHVRSGDREMELYLSLRYRTETQTTTPDSKRRGFQSQVSVDKTPVADIHCVYVGKKPEEPIAKPIERDWAAADTDFYHYTISNLSSNAIELRQIEYALIGIPSPGDQDGDISKPDDRETIRQELGATKLLPGESVTRRNSWIGGDGKTHRTLQKVYHIHSNNRDMKLYVNLPYRSEKK